MTLRLLPALVVFATVCTAFGQDAPPSTPAAAPATPAAEKRKLVLARPEVKGAKYEYRGKGSQTTTADYKVEEEVRPNGSESIDVTLEGVLEVTEVSPKVGNVTGYTFTIKKMSLKDGSGEDDGLEAGTVITAKVEKFQTKFYAHGGEVQGNLESGLKLALPLFTGGDEPFDALLEPSGPVAAGEKWDVPASKIEEMVKVVNGIELDPAKSSIKVRFKGPSTVSGAEADIVAYSSSFTYAKLAGLPDDAKLIDATATLETSQTIARDTKIPAPLEGRLVSDSRTQYSGKHEGKEYEMDYKVHTERVQKMKPVK